MKIEKRTKQLKEVRQHGFTPGVIYGKDFPSTSIQVPALEFQRALQEYGTSKTFSILLDGKKHIVYVKEYQDAYMNHGSYSHFDLVKVSKNDTLHGEVDLHFIGKEIFNKSNLVFTSNLDEIEVEYNVGSGISHLDVNVEELTEHLPLYVKDLALPKGITVLNNPEQIVCALSQATVIEDKPEEDEQEGFTAEEIE